MFSAATDDQLNTRYSEKVARPDRAIGAGKYMNFNRYNLNNKHSASVFITFIAFQILTNNNIHKVI